MTVLICVCADSGVKFEGESAYDHDFHAHPLEKRAPMAPAPPPRNNAKFDGTSTYHVSIFSPHWICNYNLVSLRCHSWFLLHGLVHTAESSFIRCSIHGHGTANAATYWCMPDAAADV